MSERLFVKMVHGLRNERGLYVPIAGEAPINAPEEIVLLDLFDFES